VLRSSKKSYKTPTGIVTFGGGGGDSSTPRNRMRSVNPITASVTFSESEERMVDDIHLDDMKNGQVTNAIVVSSQVEVTHSDRYSPLHGTSAQRAHEHW
jgi:hypothetical protein